MYRFFGADGIGSDIIEDGDREQPETDEQQSRHRSALKCHLQRGVQTSVGRLGRAHIRADSDDHADIAGSCGGYRSDEKSNRRDEPELI